MKKELNEKFIRELSKKKNEPEWMLEFRLNSYKKFLELKQFSEDALFAKKRIVELKEMRPKRNGFLHIVG